MKISPLKINGCFLIELEKKADQRGYFARSWCQQEFKAHGLVENWVQSNLSYNEKKGTLRGMHLQTPPHEEIKLVRVIRGAIYDVMLDLRKESETYLQWESIELNEDNSKSVYIPEGIAHGFLTLRDKTEVFYEMSEFFHPESSHGYRYDDPAFNITWPDVGNLICSEADKSRTDYSS